MKADNLRIPALAVTIFGWVVVVATGIAAFFNAVWLVAYTQLAESPWMAVTSGFAAAIGWLAFLPSIIAVLVWIYLAHSNLHKAGLNGLNYAPAWATLSILVPIANLFVPFRAMRELANRSTGEPEELAEADVQDVFSWWGCWLGSMLIGTFLAYTTLVEVTPGLYITTPFWGTLVLVICGNLLTSGAAFFLIRTVKMVTVGQKEGVTDLGTFE
ncbi:DUF4328 domain-containing protein [Erythrobacter sp. Alg231-14]|uniref:DUF4328 domain-containing protein n=1 Tax=Erythrobacter sp. Alg231-14 TaxID=1922225 RepID=UPI00307B3D07